MVAAARKTGELFAQLKVSQICACQNLLWTQGWGRHTNTHQLKHATWMKIVFKAVKTPQISCSQQVSSVSLLSTNNKPCIILWDLQIKHACEQLVFIYSAALHKCTCFQAWSCYREQKNHKATQLHSSKLQQLNWRSCQMFELAHLQNVSVRLQPLKPVGWSADSFDTSDANNSCTHVVSNTCPPGACLSWPLPLLNTDTVQVKVVICASL